ncbi:MAG: Transcriptional regulator, MarR family [Brockia lithotrophica]|uniref:Transcriptional regulator, MarR family n=1 Tax=Brockia lithotrophica TaxID=933949 RepID=A0A2T5GA87_9BACL|nr:MarR family transcriptional regulator [Brockia lithotrophica]PTQ53102.1 MAG: Transcriptional regulator, MarR family [Brockia lithotrophica]
MGVDERNARGGFPRKEGERADRREAGEGGGWAIAEEVEWHLRHVSALLKQKGRELLQETPLTPPQFIALQWLKEAGNLTIGELSAKMYLANSTVTDLVDRLERGGYVRRVRASHDRRVVRVELLEAGRTIIDEVIRRRQAYLAGLLRRFSPEEAEQLRRLLARLHAEMLREFESGRPVHRDD